MNQATTKIDWSLRKNTESDRYETQEFLIKGDYIPQENYLMALGAVLARLSKSEAPIIAVQGYKKDNCILDKFTLLTLPVQLNPTVSKLKDHIDRSIFASSTNDTKEITIGLVFGSDKFKIINTDQQFPLMCIVSEQENSSFKFSCKYNLKNYSGDSILQFLNCIKNTLTLLEKNRDLNLLDYPIIDNITQNKIIEAGLVCKLENEAELRIEKYFSNIAKNQPDKIALIQSNETLTYSELDSRSEIMAKALVNKGLKPGDYVGICLERSFDLISSMLAILKAGGIYIPMDPTHPEDRKQYTCTNSNINLVITDNNDFPHNTSVLLIDPKMLKQPESGALDSVTLPENLKVEDSAYVIYTSGSSGRPKGVVVSHFNVISLLEAMKYNYDFTSSDTWTFYHSAAFDFSVWEIWGSLLTGAQLVIVSYWDARSPENFRSLLMEKNVTILNQTPSAFSQLIHAELKQPDTNKLRLIMFGGETLDMPSLKNWVNKYPTNVCRLENMYGITETTVFVTSKTVTDKEINQSSRSIGKSLPGWYTYILDEKLNILPVGIPGEIYVGGVGTAQMYINQPALTAERYVPDPYRGGIMYKSGDYGLLNSDGEIEFLGRIDSQVKIRGYRIELDEIRNVLLEIDEVHSAHVVLNYSDKNDPATARLDSYIVLNSSIEIGDIADTVQKKLPIYMIPSSFTILTEIPLTHNGKIDIESLPKPETVLPQSNPSSNKQTSQSENLIDKLIEIFGDILNCSVTEDDNFFNLGGNSIFAIRITEAVEKSGLPKLTIKNIYANQFIKKIALNMLEK